VHRQAAGAKLNKVSEGSTRVDAQPEKHERNSIRLKGVKAGRLRGLEASRLRGLKAWRLEGLEASRLEGLEAWRLGGLKA
jgi:hypothetical protein